MRGWHSAAILCLLAGCASGGAERGAAPNPAARRCLDDGHRLVPVKQDGVPRWYFCIDPGTGRKCEVWAYFRGECRL